MKRRIDADHIETQFKHTQYRALRRYGYELDRSVYDQWNELIHSGQAKYAMSHEHNKRFEVWALQTESLGKIAVGFDTLNNTISTILPRSSVEHYHYLAHSYECQLLAMQQAAPRDAQLSDLFDECEACHDSDRSVRLRKIGYELCAKCATIAAMIVKDMDRSIQLMSFFAKRPPVIQSKTEADQNTVTPEEGISE